MRFPLGIVVGLIAGAIITAAVFVGRSFSLTLTGLDLFFILTALVSLGFNIWQSFRDRYKYAPLKNALIGLFNDLKDRKLRAHQRQQLLMAPVYNQLPVAAIGVEFVDYVNETMLSFEQLREHVAGAIQTLDPSTSDQAIFNAGDFGLTEQERKFRADGLARYARAFERQDPAVTGLAAAAPQAGQQPGEQQPGGRTEEGQTR